MSDQELVNAVTGGNIKAFEQLVNTYKKSVFNTVLGFLRDVENAEEVTQDVFIKIYETIGGFKGEAKLSTWIYRISVNQSLDYLRKAKRKKRFATLLSLFNSENEVIYQPVNFDHPGVLMENKEKAALLFKAIDELPDKQKTAFLLQKVEHCSQQKIAEIMQLNEGAVESLLTRAKLNLRKSLTKYYAS